MTDVPAWTDRLSVLIAGIALAISLPSLGISWAAYRLAKRQDQRRAPKLALALRNYDYTRLPELPGRAYCFDLAISNLSDADNAVAEIDLEMAYRRQGLEMTARIPMSHAHTATFIAPQKIDAHDTVAGRACFTVPDLYVEGAIIGGVCVVITDSHGERIRTGAPLIVERRSD